MPFTAQHAEYGRLDATRPELGCGLDWGAIHRARAPLHCPACESQMVARVSVLGLRHFAHRRRSPDCPLAGESVGHLLLKSDLAAAARAAGWSATLEVAASHGGWRADVLAVSPDGRRIALEAQLSPITEHEVRERTARYEVDGVEVCWFDDRDRPRPWMGAVPSLHLTGPAGASRTVRGVIARYSAGTGWHAVDDVTLTDAVKWILGRRLIPHGQGYVHGLDDAHRWGYRGMFWTAAPYAAAASEEARRRRTQQEAAEARWEAREAAKKVKAAAYERFWARTGIGPGWWRAFEAIVRGAMGDDTFFGAPSQRYGDGRPLYEKRGGGTQLLAVALPARLGAWAETTPVVVDDLAGLERMTQLAFCDVKVLLAAPDTGAFEMHWVGPGTVY
ncbi:competence protein CoiA [Streptomyces sp. NBC_01240]|uniref:competence protein CoiA n=1 Tax=Streptomyces sp. NBC_01240 TaxID=2903793 RepID=UPI002E113233|nr:competence protein CoiA family protein [Streptomyces sp. NBC_01240]